MSFSKTMKQKFLNSSDSYNYYKNKAKKADKLDKELKYLKKQIQNTNKKISKIEKRNEYYEKVINSNNFIFNNLLLNYELQPKGILKNMQTLCQELLDLTVNICNKHKIDYWLDGGNLLGAIRHGGFIPWDDDMDIAMMRKDYNKFSDIIDYEIQIHGLEDKIIIHKDQEVRKNFINPFIQLLYMDGENSLSGIDIFPFDFTDNYKISPNDHAKARKKFYIKLCTGTERKEVINEYYDELKLKWDDGNFIIPGIETPRYSAGYANKFYLWKKHRIIPFKSVEFNGKEYNCPNDSDYYLETTYRNFMKIPPVINHHHSNVEDIRKNENVTIKYEEAIKKLRSINENF